MSFSISSWVWCYFVFFTIVVAIGDEFDDTIVAIFIDVVPSDIVLLLVHTRRGQESFVTVIAIRVVVAVVAADAVLIFVSTTAKSVVHIDWLSDACTLITLDPLLPFPILLLLAFTRIVLLRFHCYI